MKRRKRVVSEYGIDLSKFATEKQLVAHLQRRGTTGARAGQALPMAATGLKNCETPLWEDTQTKGASVAVFATARKLGTIIYRRYNVAYPMSTRADKHTKPNSRLARLRSLAKRSTELGMQILPKTPPATC